MMSSLTGKGGKTNFLQMSQYSIIKAATRHARDGLFDHLIMIAALAAGRMIVTDWFGLETGSSHSVAGCRPTNAEILRSGRKGHRK